MIKAIYPGKFDPITTNQLNIISRANELVDKLIIGIYIDENVDFYFSPLERKNMIQEKVAKEISCEYYDGLLINFMKKFGSNLIIKTLYSISSFELEFQTAQLNKKMNKDIETIFLIPRDKYNFWVYNY